MKGVYILSIMFLISCSRGPEGTEPGDCEDDSDNDKDGKIDCADDGCAASEFCRQLAAKVSEMEERAKQQELAEKSKKPEATQGPVFEIDGLIVQTGHNGSDINWKQAEQYCVNLEIDGKKNWRLPKQQEAVKIVESGKLGNEPSYVMWTSTKKGKKSAVIVGVSGAVNILGLGNKGQCRARCVFDSAQ
jgi:hypothetical protein